ncbi:uncharacterized protein LOC106475076 [Limulus polyphemus]|uniref:Uncharacterized protein LOC106475076 n=1 Tax=Limulus polyphemus TaxID=6850 RepID=A0ABM1BYS1_LIMPO|nr:uncharacterized protein LOC106475076 [Limulus polyphemus]
MVSLYKRRLLGLATGLVLIALSHCQPLDGDTAAAKQNKYKPKFVTPKVQVSLSCKSDKIMVTMNFTEPFNGVAHAGDKESPCKLRGIGDKNYILNVPLTSCGTRHEQSSGNFINTLTIRFHPSLELEGDEIKTIICKFNTGSINVG